MIRWQIDYWRSNVNVKWLPLRKKVYTQNGSKLEGSLFIKSFNNLKYFGLSIKFSWVLVLMVVYHDNYQRKLKMVICGFRRKLKYMLVISFSSISKEFCFPFFFFKYNIRNVSILFLFSKTTVYFTYPLHGFASLFCLSFKLYKKIWNYFDLLNID